MQTKITRRGQTVVPAAIRKRYNIRAGDRLVWLDDGETIKVIPISSDPVSALRGTGEGEDLLEALLQFREEERSRDQ